jgi:DNA-directed RNA polymerase III subunit RPC4
MDDDVEVYSDPEDGVEIVDMDDVKRMDWMAPESLSKEKAKSAKKKIAVQKEPKVDIKGKGKGRHSHPRCIIDSHICYATAEEEPMDVDEKPEVDNANALDLSESEEEEEIEDIVHDFDTNADEQVCGLRHALLCVSDYGRQESDFRSEKLLLFQFPLPFPEFTGPTQDTSQTPVVETSTDPKPDPKPVEKGKKVSFAPDVKSEAGSGPSTPATVSDAATPAPEKSTLDGAIGQLEIHRSGAVKMRLDNGMLFDVGTVPGVILVY